ncbi:uncharacterized protein C8A04DRAFT_38955 [Dichotomopilus funicola]|uniref:Autophagy protein n=1 Tax=Dichotomopilus funicola TaxID=1934379 RepID=A0AAN6UYG3_9PEZI|nr:hypothetical protein C8A04DRAFT_38955 [Dichotomopilus funicola]
MGWFDGWFGSSSSDSDPLSRLDPKLREFLEKESPIKYNPPPQPNPQVSPPPPAKQQAPSQEPQQNQQQDEQQQPAVPPQSLYQDGRYAHLWKTYRPLAAVEAETKSDNEKLSDVLEAYKDRRGLIGRAALENCAEEQVVWSDCMRSGSWHSRMTMCSAEVRKFERCYNAQSRLLKALGYLSVRGRDRDVDEEIQMHADELYHRMMAQEREIEKAKEEGREPPVFKGLFDGTSATMITAPTPSTTSTTAAADTASSSAATTPGQPKIPEPNEATLAAWKKQLEKLPPEEREAEEKALRADYRARVEMARQVQSLWQQQAKEREVRKAEGKETFMDRMSAFAGSWSRPKEG